MTDSELIAAMADAIQNELDFEAISWSLVNYGVPNALFIATPEIERRLLEKLALPSEGVNGMEGAGSLAISRGLDRGDAGLDIATDCWLAMLSKFIEQRGEK